MLRHSVYWQCHLKKLRRTKLISFIKFLIYKQNQTTNCTKKYNTFEKINKFPPFLKMTINYTNQKRKAYYDYYYDEFIIVLLCEVPNSKTTIRKL